MTEDLKALDEHIRACMVVFGCLLVLTLLTVFASYLKVPTEAAIAIALCIASVKGTMVALYFMHLISEKWLIYFSLALTGVFFLTLMLLPILTQMDPIEFLELKAY